MATHAPPRRQDTASRIVEAAPGVVYRAFGDGESLMQWLPPGGMTGTALEYNFREGGRYRIALRYDDAAVAGKSDAHTDVSTGRFLQLAPGRRIEQSVEFEADDPAFAGTMTMVWSFEPAVHGTRVTITARDVPPGITPEDHQAGLNASLDNLARFVRRL